MADTRPNFLVIMTEQHRGDSLGCEGHPVLLTPTLDEVAVKGARFARAYTPCPICVPARASFLTGLEPATHGIVGWGFRDWRAPTVADELAKAGYETAWIGRTMHQVPPEEPRGFRTLIHNGMTVVNDAYRQFLDRNQPEGGGGYYGSGVMHNDWTARPFHLPEHLHHTNWVVNETLGYLGRRDSGRPFFLVVSFMAAHPPLIPPSCYFERYIRTGAPEPACGDWAEPPPNGGIGAGPSSARVHLRGEALLSAKAGYHGLINHLDDQLHRLLNDIDGIDRMTDGNTVVMMTSDHGEMLGDHHRWRKSLPYEGAARIPLLVRAPRRFGLQAGAVIDRPVGLQDIAPTVLELAGAPVPKSMEGRSLLPILRGDPDAAWRPWIHIEHAGGWHALIDGHEKYAWWTETGREQLFDLDADPRELHDLARDTGSGPRLAMWRERLVAKLAGRPEGFSDGVRLITGRPYPALIVR